MNISETQIGVSMTHDDYIDSFMSVNKNNESNVREDRFLCLNGRIIASYIDNNHVVVKWCSSLLEEDFITAMLITECKKTDIKLIYIVNYDNNKFIKITERLEHMVKVFKNQNILGDYI